jgi:hypothetical protein
MGGFWEGHTFQPATPSHSLFKAAQLKHREIYACVPACACKTQGKVVAVGREEQTAFHVTPSSVGSISTLYVEDKQTHQLPHLTWRTCHLPRWMGLIVNPVGGEGGGQSLWPLL